MIRHGRFWAPQAPDQSFRDLLRTYLLATIDESTATLPTDYRFTADLVGRSNTSPVVIPLKSCNADTQVSIPQLDTFDWHRYPGLVYGSPDDRRIVRTHVSGTLEYRVCGEVWRQSRNDAAQDVGRSGTFHSARALSLSPLLTLSTECQEEGLV